MEAGKYTVINIRRYLDSDNPKLGENCLLQVLSGFSCPKNPDVERFLKKSSIEFTKKNQSNRFQPFDIRQTASNVEEQHELIQLLRLL